MMPQFTEGPTGPTVYVLANRDDMGDSFAKKTAESLSIAQITLGAVSIFSQVLIIITIFLYDVSYYENIVGIGEGIYCGVFFVIAGFLGLLASRKPSACKITAFMTLSIIASIVSAALIILASINLLGINMAIVSAYGFKTGLFCSMILSALTEGVVAIVSSAVCCRAVCCGGRSVQLSQEAGVVEGVAVKGTPPEDRSPNSDPQTRSRFEAEIINHAPIIPVNFSIIQCPQTSLYQMTLNTDEYLERLKNAFGVYDLRKTLNPTPQQAELQQPNTTLNAASPSNPQNKTPHQLSKDDESLLIECSPSPITSLTNHLEPEPEKPPRNPTHFQSPTISLEAGPATPSENKDDKTHPATPPPKAGEGQKTSFLNRPLRTAGRSLTLEVANLKSLARELQISLETLKNRNIKLENTLQEQEYCAHLL